MCGAWCSLLKRSEYKRRQAPVGIRITQRGFGKDWRYPITNRYRDRIEETVIAASARLSAIRIRVLVNFKEYR